MDFDIIQYKSDYKEGVISLLQFLWKDLDDIQREKLFEWKYENNPNTDTVVAFIALVNNRVVCFRGWFIQKFCYNDKVFSVASASDAITHPDYQRKGLFEKTSKASFNYFEKNCSFIGHLNISSNNLSANGNIKLGWAPIALKKHLYLIKPGYFFLNLLSGRNSINNLKIEKKNINKKDKYEITDKVYSKDIERLSTKNRQKNVLVNVKDNTFYNWRFNNPVAHYFFAYLWELDTLTSFIAFSFINHNSISIVDYNFDKFEDFRFLLKTVSKNIKPSYINILNVTLDFSFIKNFKSMGFLPFKDYFNFIRQPNYLPVLFRPNSQKCDNEDFIFEGINLKDIKNWYISEIDADGA